MSSFNLMPLLPEIWVLFLACAVLIAAVIWPQNKRLPYYLTQFGLAIGLAILLVLYLYPVIPIDTQTAYHGFVFDHLSVVLKVFIYVSVMLSLLYSYGYNIDRMIPMTEFCVLVLLSTLGMFILVSAHTLVMIYLGMELLSLPTYALVAITRHDQRSIEAAVKYFVMGAAASAFLLFGMSLVYAGSLTFDLSAIVTALSNHPAHNHAIFLSGLAFFFVGILFKLGAAPFHWWVPDLFEGAPASTTILVATAPKIAGLALTIRLLVQGLPGLVAQWHSIFIVVGLLSLAVGNLGALLQTNFRRLLGYSSIAHMGFMLLGFAAGTSRGYASATFYILSYTFMTLVALGVLTILSRSGKEVESLDDLAGLGTGHPFLAFMMFVVMFSMAGVPPLVGFIAKLLVLESLIQAGMVWLVVVALLFTIMAAYYYIRVVKVMYFQKAEQPQILHGSYVSSFVLGVNGVLIFALGFIPAPLLAWCHVAFLS